MEEIHKGAAIFPSAPRPAPGKVCPHEHPRGLKERSNLWYMATTEGVFENTLLKPSITACGRRATKAAGAGTMCMHTYYCRRPETAYCNIHMQIQSFTRIVRIGSSLLGTGQPSSPMNLMLNQKQCPLAQVSVSRCHTRLRIEMRQQTSNASEGALLL